jgi:hypothetical protein
MGYKGAEVSTGYKFESGSELEIRLQDGFLWLLADDGSRDVAWLRLTPKEAAIVADGIKKAIE